MVKVVFSIIKVQKRKRKERSKKMKAKKLWKILAAVLSVCMLGVAAAGCNNGGADDASSNITRAIGREAASGTRSAFHELVKSSEGVSIEEALESAQLSTAVSESTSTAAVITAVAQRYDTLGYISLGSLAPNADKVQAVKVEGVDATVENVVNKSYKLSRPFNLVWNEQRFNANDLAVNFVNFIESEAGQEIIGEEGYVTVSGLQIKTYTAYTGTKTVLNITGSTSVEPLMRKFVAAYTELNPGITVNIDAQGSGQGITGAQEGTNDIGMSSRDLKSSETGIVSHKIADDGIAVIVKKGSKLTNVTFDQLFNLYMKGTAIEAK